MDLYCVKCRIRTPTIDLTETVTKNNRNAITGRCETCDTKKFRFGKATTKKKDQRDSKQSLNKVQTSLEETSQPDYLNSQEYLGQNTQEKNIIQDIITADQEHD